MNVKSLKKIDLADEKQLPGDDVAAHLLIHINSINTNHLGYLAAEQDACQRNPCNHSKRKIMWGGEHGDGEGHQHHRRVALRDCPKATQSSDVSCAHGDADHHSHQCRHGDLFEPWPAQQNHGQQADP